ncbi:YceI family protein [Hyphobacterium indicum]|uniref:YceI family protein n=1 Tax=Hyphobacterium indicum TaxID=2162714 RepID=UPI000D64D27B|nr:YceI family protein [Hyphobacterium indicum]
MLRLLALALLAAPAAHAGDWRVDADASSMTFETEAFGAPVTGEIGEFEADIHLDPDAPETGRIEARVGVASVDAGSSQFNDPLQSDAGFAPDSHPYARFVSEQVTEIMDCEAGNGARCYTAEGDLMLKGETRPATLHFRLAVVEDRAIADGELAIDRRDFGIGGASWGDTGAEVTVRIHIEAISAD